MAKKKIKEKISVKEVVIDTLIIVLIWLFLFTYFKPELMFSTTTTSGGDTGSHNYLAKFMKENIARGKIIGWSHDWYAGLPMFQFYFPLAYILIAFLNFFIHANIAFKIITILGTFMMPLCAYITFRIFGFRFPLPAFGAILTLPFLFLQSNSMYGGNIPSTLAGEFSFSISMALSLIFIASLYKGITTKKMLVFNIILLSIISLFHIVPIITIALSSLFFLRKDIKSNFKYLLLVYLGAFLLVGFWSIPFIAKLEYATSSSFTASRNLSDILPENFSILLLFTAIGIASAFRKNDNRVLFLATLLVTSFILFSITPTGHVWNTRFLPWYYMMTVLIAAYGINELLSRVKPQILLPVIILIIVVVLVNNYATYIRNWIEWNYSGFESKSQWKTFDEMNSYLNSLSYGKVLHEYSSSHDSMFGTPRAFELIPYFTNKPGMEGLLIESSASSPFFFYLQSEISQTPTCPISTFKCTFFNIAGATQHMELFNVKYLVATSAKLKDALSDNGNFTLLKKINDIWMYELNRKNGYVAPLKYQPVVAERSKWHNLSSEWIRSEFSDVTIIYDTTLPYEKIQNVNEIIRKPLDSCDVDEKLNGNEEIKITTDCIGKPLLVKVTYSPNWQVDGGEIYLASPSFFVVIPSKANVRIHYSNTFVDWIGIFATISMSIIILNMRYKWIKL